MASRSDPSRLETIDRIADDFESRWKAGTRPDIGQFIEGLEEQTRLDTLAELVLLDIDYCHRAGQRPALDDYTEQFPELRQRRNSLRREAARLIRQIQFRQSVTKGRSPKEKQDTDGGGSATTEDITVEMALTPTPIAIPGHQSGGELTTEISNYLSGRPNIAADAVDIRRRKLRQFWWVVAIVGGAAAVLVVLTLPVPAPNPVAGVIVPETAQIETSLSPAPQRAPVVEDMNPPSLAAGMSVPATATSAVLPHQAVTLIGSIPNARGGFPQYGPVFAGADSLRLAVPASGPIVADLSITRLYMCRQDIVLKGNRYGVPRDVNLWIPREVGAFTAVVADEVTGAARWVRPSRRLPDGVYCIHNGVLADGKPLPSYSSTFVIGGVSKPVVERTQVRMENSKVLLEVLIRNDGDGEFNEGRVMLTLQTETAGRAQFQERWESRLEAVPKRQSQTFRREFDAANWAPGRYHFWGHVFYDHVLGDTAAAIVDIRSDSFTLPPNN